MRDQRRGWQRADRLEEGIVKAPKDLGHVDQDRISLLEIGVIHSEVNGVSKSFKK